LVFSTQEKRKVEKLILKIFERELLKLKSGNRESSILRGRNPSYSGTVIFEDNWLRVREHSIVFALKCAAAAVLVAIWISLGALFGFAVAVLLSDGPEPTDPLLFEILGGVLSIPILIGYVRMRPNSAHKWPKTLTGRTASWVASGMVIGAVAWGLLKAS